MIFMAERAVKPIAQKCVDILKERGWTQGQYEDEDGAVCALGALQYALGGNLCEDPQGDSTVQTRTGLDVHQLDLRYQIQRSIKFKLGMPIAEYNDMDGRTVDDIIDVFEGLE